MTFKDVLATMADNEFSIVVSEVYKSGTLVLKNVRCPSNAALSAGVNRELQNDTAPSINKLGLMRMLSAFGLCLAKSPVKGAGFTHIYTFAPATVENPGIELMAMYSIDVGYKYDKNKQDMFLSLANRFLGLNDVRSQMDEYEAATVINSTVSEESVYASLPESFKKLFEEPTNAN